MCVQYVNRPHLNFRGFCGNIVSGSVKKGDEIVVLPSLKQSRVKEIISTDIKHLRALTQDEKIEGVQESFCPNAITLTLEDEIDISRGDVIASKNNDIEMGNSFEAMLIWMSEIKLDLNENYLIKIGNRLTNLQINRICCKKNINTFEEIQADTLELNDIAKCVLRLNKKIPLKKYKDNKTLGSFIVIDKYSNQTIGAGMIFNIFQNDTQERIYTSAEKELNAYIRRNYPEWGCKEI